MECHKGFERCSAGFLQILPDVSLAIIKTVQLEIQKSNRFFYWDVHIIFQLLRKSLKIFCSTTDQQPSINPQMVMLCVCVFFGAIIMVVVESSQESGIFQEIRG